MTGMEAVRDFRFEGMDIPELQKWIDEIKDGRGPESMETAARSLERCVQVVVDLDETLRRELGKLQIEWEGQAGSIAQQATHEQTVVMEESQAPLKASSASVQAQGQGYSTAKNGLPNAGELQHQQSENVLEWSGGAFGYESDYDKEAKQIDGQKKAAQAALGSYRDTTVQQADVYQPLPEMPVPAAVTSQSASGTGASNVNTDFGSLATRSGSIGGGELGGSMGNGGSGNTGGGAGDTGSGDGGRSDGGRSGGGGEGDRGGPGGEADRNPHDDPKDESGIGLNGILGIGAGGAAVAGLGAMAAGRLLGGKSMPEGPARGPTAPKGGSSGIGGGPGDTTAGRTASGAATSRPGSGSMMGPAATRGKQTQGEDEAEHENKYVQDETPFDDNRLVAPSILGENSGESDDEKQN